MYMPYIGAELWLSDKVQIKSIFCPDSRGGLKPFAILVPGDPISSSHLSWH